MSRADQGRQTLLEMLGPDGQKPVEEVLEHLTYCPIGVRPTVALATVAARPNDFRTPFLAELTRSPANLDEREAARPDDRHAYFLHTFALYFLALWEEPRAFAPIVAYLAADSHLAAEQLDDTVTEHLPAILARTYDGSDLGPLKAVIEDPSAEMWVRGACLRSLHAMALMHKLPRETMLTYFADIAQRLQPLTTDDFGLELVSALADAKEPALRAPIEQWFAAGLVDEDIVKRADIDEAYAEAPEHVYGQLLQREYFDNLMDELSEWPWFNSTDPDEFDEDDETLEDTLDFATHQPHVREGRKIGRNEPCPCGSGKKYKKCCLAEA
ncbi:MAG: DUF1186 domain-containing protein [Hyphomicrobiaceae bacterium]